MKEPAVCKLCRREGAKLFLKSDRCYTDKCSFERRDYPGGQHGQQRRKFTEYGVQLREKQKVKRIYGLGETQFRNTFDKAVSKKGITGEILLQMLERRLDNVVFRMGLAGSRREARHFVRHAHFTVNGKKVNIPAYQIKAGDEIALRERSQKVQRIIDAAGAVDRRGVPEWLEFDAKALKGKVRMLPSRGDVASDLQEQLIVELYSK